MSGERVLVVDDEPSVCELVATRLSLDGYGVDGATDPRRALRMVTEGYDLVYIDIHMPGIDGEEFLKHARSVLPGAGMVIITGLPDARQAVRLMKLGADDYLIKPLDMDALSFSARRAIERKGLVAENERYRIELEERLKERAELQRQRQDLWNMAVHDLKNPLAQVMGRIELLAERARGKLDDAEMTDVERAHSGCRHMLRLINNLLDMARLESLEATVHVAEVDLTAAARAAVENWSATAALEGLELECGGAARPVKVLADARIVERVLDNLLANAVEHAADGGWIRIETFEDAAGALGGVSVADGGPGVPPEIRDRIFEKYFSTSDSARASSARGLGLAYCRTAIEALRGVIGVTDGDVGGSVFTVALPAASAEREKSGSKAVAAGEGVA